MLRLAANLDAVPQQPVPLVVDCMASLFDYIGVVLGVLGLVSAVPIVFQWLENRLPEALLRSLELVLYDIENILSDLGRHGVVFETLARRDYQDQIASIESRARNARLRTFRPTTFRAQLGALRSGLSKELSELRDEAIQLRASICDAALDVQVVLPAGSPYLRYRDTMPVIPTTTHLPRSDSPPPSYPSSPHSPQSSGAPHAPLRPALRPPLRTLDASSRHAKRRRRAQSLPAVRFLVPPADFAGETEVGDLDSGGLRRRNAGQRKVQFDRAVDVLEYDALSEVGVESDSA